VTRHPIRVVVDDDLERWRLTVFFRLLLAIPHYVWAFLWTIAAFVVAVASWFATLVQGSTPGALHGFLERYVRYLTHLSAYLLLTADPYPPFNGKDGYPVDVEIDPPVQQARWAVALRLVVALPALVLASTLIGYGSQGGQWSHMRGSSYALQATGAANAVAFLGWFACLVRGRMPRGFRDLQAYALRYSAQTWGYLLLLTDRYPNARPAEPPAAPPEDPHPVSLALADDLARSRLTVFFRLLLALPHLVWITLWFIVLLPVLVVAWTIVLVRRQAPASLNRFICAYLRYQTHLSAFLYLAADPFPAFNGAPGYPVDLMLPAEPQPQHRGKTAVRLLLVVPAWITAAGLGGAAVVAAILGWFAALLTARMPRGLRDLEAWSIRYTVQADAYLFLVTDCYPYAGPYEFAEPPVEDAEALLVA
jgi:hypothetical protein